MKRIVTAAVASLSLLVGMAFAFPTVARADGSADGYAYVMNGDHTVAITHSYWATDSITIPDTLDGYTVTEIGAAAFQDYSYSSVTFNTTALQKIDGESFQRCTSLTGISIPSTVLSIGEYAFDGCYNLGTVTFSGSSLTTIGINAFQYCTKLSDVVLPNSLTTLGDSAFLNCTALTSAALSTHLTEIAEHAFQCSGLTSITIPEGVTALDFNAFNSCQSLESVSLPGSLPTIGDDVFCGCGSLTGVTLPSGVKSIGVDSFGDCNILSAVILSEGLLKIGDGAFYGDPLLQEITIPSTVTEIGAGAFYDSHGLAKCNILSKTAVFDDTGIFIDTAIKSDPVNGGIFGYASSTAQTFASANGIPFHTGPLVTFDSKGGSAVASEFVLSGAPVPMPANPVRAGYGFTGWYTNPACTPASKWDFSKPVNADMTLYAGWLINSAYLSDVHLTAGTLSPAFSRRHLSYTVKLSENEDTVTITPVLENPSATMTIDGAAVPDKTVSLANGKSQTVKVKVKSGAQTKVYSFVVKRDKSTNNKLASLTAASGPTPLSFVETFDPDTTAYHLNLDENTASATISDTVAATGLATATFSTKIFTLHNDETKVVKIKVKAQSGVSKTYTVTIYRNKSTDAFLSSITAGKLSLSPAFDKNTDTYTVTMNASQNTVTITVKAEGYKAAVMMNGVMKTSMTVKLSPGGSLPVTIVVTPQAEAAYAKTYQVTVSRP